MNFKKLFLVFIFSLFIGIFSVKATCYKVYTSSSEYQYVSVNTRTICDPNTKKCNKVEDDINIPNIVSKEVVSDSICTFGEDAYEKHNDEVHPNYNPNNVVSCGGGFLTDIPKALPKTIHLIYLFLQIAVPIILVIFGSIDFVKAVVAQKEDEINKGRQIFIKRLIYGTIIFFIFSIVKFLISFVGDKNSKTKIINCASCLINNDSNCVAGES